MRRATFFAVLALLLAAAAAATIEDEQWGCTNFLTGVRPIVSGGGAYVTAAAATAISYTQRVVELNGTFGTVVSNNVASPHAPPPSQTFATVPGSPETALFAMPLWVDSAARFLEAPLAEQLPLPRAPFGSLGAMVVVGSNLEVDRAWCWSSRYGVRVAQSGPGLVGAGYLAAHGKTAGIDPYVEVDSVAEAEAVAVALLRDGATVLYVADMASLDAQFPGGAQAAVAAAVAVGSAHAVPVLVAATTDAEVVAALDGGATVLFGVPAETLLPGTLARLAGVVVIAPLSGGGSAVTSRAAAMAGAGATVLYGSGALSSARAGVSRPGVFESELDLLTAALGSRQAALRACMYEPGRVWDQYAGMFPNSTGAMGDLTAGSAASFGLYATDPVADADAFQAPEFTVGMGYEMGCLVDNDDEDRCLQCYVPRDPDPVYYADADPSVETIVGLVVASAFVLFVLTMVFIGFSLYILRNRGWKEADLRRHEGLDYTYIRPEELDKRDLKRTGNVSLLPAIFK